MDVLENIKNNVYKTKYDFPKYPGKSTEADREEYKKKRKQWNDDTRRLEREVFRKDLAEEFEMTDHPKEEKVWNKAWADSHSGGLTEVYYEYEELVDIAK